MQAGTLGLLQRAKDEKDGQAREELFARLRRDGRTKTALRGMWRGAACMDFEDIEGEFWLGVLASLPKVQAGIGDPVSHLIQRGIWQVKSAMREELNRKVVQECTACGKSNGTYAYDRRCQRCGQDCENTYRLVPEDALDSHSYLDSVADVTIAVMRRGLAVNQLRVLDALLSAYYTHPEAPIAQVAVLLKVSRQRVHQLIEKLKDALRYLTTG